MSQSHRIDAKLGGGRIDRTRTLRFTFDGIPYQGHPGDTLASALLANGVRLMGRSFKYHRPRGVLSFANHDVNDVVESPGHTNIRADITPVRDGDEFVAVRQLYGGSINQFGHAFKSFGWNVRWADARDPDSFRRQLTAKTKAIFLNTPHNPTGAVLSRMDLDSAATLPPVLAASTMNGPVGRLLPRNERNAPRTPDATPNTAAITSMRCMRSVRRYAAAAGGNYGLRASGSVLNNRMAANPRSNARSMMIVEST